MENNFNFVHTIKEIESQIKNLEIEFERKCKPYKDSLIALRKINTACEDCFGKGKILRTRSCAEDDRPDPNDPNDWNTCKTCNGTGLNRMEIK